MLERIREQTGSAGLIVGVIALVLAVAGGAYAAGGGLSGKQKKEVTKIAKQYAGKPGAQGPAGANGKDGANGANGSNGAPGANGKSVKVTAATIVQCEERGGVIVEKEGEAASAKEVCNGEEGSPWTAGGTLPKGATETGAWTFHAVEGTTEEVFAALSFPIQLSAPLGADKVHYESEANFGDFDEGGPGTVGCEGTAVAPKAPEGNLCVFGNNNVENATFGGVKLFNGVGKGANKTGALLLFNGEGTGAPFGGGSFAVTGF